MHTNDDAIRRIAPRYGVESELHRIWVELLGHDSFGVLDNFFDVGGTSFTLIKLLHCVEELSGYSVSIVSFVRAPTIAGLALLLRGAATDNGQTVVPIKPSGSRPPLFCIHPIGGSVIRYFPLARALEKEQPVYGLQALGLTGEKPPQRWIHEIASSCFSEIMRICPDGPVQILGFSFGGIVAYEIAQLALKQQGKHPLVALIDTPAVASDAHDDKDTLPTAAYVAMNALVAEIEPDMFRGLGQTEALTLLHSIGVREGIFDGTFSVSWLRRIIDTIDGNIHAMKHYTLQGYPGHVITFGCGSTAVVGWEQYVDQLTTYELDVEHFWALDEPCASVIASLLTRHLLK